jgi:hypothetical protein
MTFNSKILFDFTELSEDKGVVEMVAPRRFINKSSQESPIKVGGG